MHTHTHTHNKGTCLKTAARSEEAALCIPPAYMCMSSPHAFAWVFWEDALP